MRMLVIAAVACAHLLLAQQDEDALAKAMRFGDHHNWADAHPWFEKAKAEAGRDERKALFAEIGILRSTMQHRGLIDASTWLSGLLRENALLKNDDELRYFALTVKGEIDFEIDVRPAHADWDEACAIAERLKNPKWLWRCQGELGFIAFVEGDVTRSTSNVLSALQRATVGQDVGARMRYLAGIGTGLTMMKSYQAGLDRLNEALAIEAQNQPFAGYNFPAREGKVMALLGLGRKDEAYALSAELLREARARGFLVKECQLLMILGRHMRDEGNRDEAIKYYTQAKALAETGQFMRFLAEAQNALAVLRAEAGDHAGALELAAKAAEATQRSGDFYLLPNRLLNLGKLQATLGKTDEARATFALGEAAADLLIGWASALNIKVSLVSTLSSIYQEHFLSHARVGDVAGAFAVVEAIRARTIREVMTAGMPSTSSDHNAIAESRARLAKAARLSELFTLQTEATTIERAAWSATQRGLASPATLSTLQQGLPIDTVLLEYSLTEQDAYCIAITNTTARLLRLPASSKEIGTTLAKLAAALKAKVQGGEDARAAYESLVAPLTELRTRKRVLIARDGPLHLVPFEAFVNGDGRYFVLTHEISYIPSAATFTLLRAQERKAGAGFLGVGGVPYDVAAKNISRVRGYARTLGNLPGSADEIKNAASSLNRPNTKLLLGNDATETALKGAALDRQVIHLAVHGWANTAYPERAALALLPAPGKDDGLLESSEIAALRVNADLVILSACETAVGMVIGEDGIANLSRAFMAGGTRAVISTLWEADDTAAASLLKRFYEQVKLPRATVGSALTGAKRELITTYKLAPYYWAPYIAEGDTNFRLQ